ncbi:hypothetical protein [Bacillus songklensis]|uniref:hypothetical protein n=1 Tax=Bacillus songklensis TaxID=1069116 RepID=UPI00366D697C
MGPCSNTAGRRNEKAKQLDPLFYLIGRDEFQQAIFPILQSGEEEAIQRQQVAR